MYALFKDGKQISRKWPLFIAMALFQHYANPAMLIAGYTIDEVKELKDNE